MEDGADLAGIAFKDKLGARGPASASCFCESRSYPSNLSGKGSAQYLSESYVTIGERLFLMKALIHTH